MAIFTSYVELPEDKPLNLESMTVKSIQGGAPRDVWKLIPIHFYVVGPRLTSARGVFV